jgi:hypothetical protein
MSYISFSELEESSSMTQRFWKGDPLQDQVKIPSRSVRFREPITDTVRFNKEEPSTEIESIVKFQVPCDTIRPSSDDFQQTHKLYLVR